MIENIEIIDKDYEKIKQAEEARPIKTRSQSFYSIYANFKKEVLRLRLESMKDSAVAEKYDVDMSYKNLQKEVGKKANAIAKLEEEILVLSRDDVPQDYVESRAIKLKNSMMNMLTSHAASAYNNSYSIGEENKESVFGDFEQEIEEQVEEKVEEQNNDKPLDLDSDGVLFSIEPSSIENEEQDAINVVPTELERKDIENAISEEFAGVEEDTNDDSINIITPEEVKSVVQEGSSNVDDEEIDKDEIENVIGSALGNIEVEETEEDVVQNEDKMDDVDHNSIKDELDRVMEKVRVTGSAPARINRFDDNGDKVDVDKVEEDTNEVNVRDELDKAIGSVINDNSVHSVANDDITKRVEDGISKEKGNDLTDLDREMIRREVQKVISEERNLRSGYTPLTDEEVALSQEKLRLTDEEIAHPKVELGLTDEEIAHPKEKSKLSDEELIEKFKIPTFENLLKPVEEEKEEGEQIREVPIVVPDRDSFVPVVEVEMSENRVVDDKIPVSRKSQIDTYNALKDKLRALKEQQRLTQQEREIAQRNAESIADKAKEARRLAAESDKLREEQLKRLREYTESLEEDCKLNEKNRKLAEDDAVMNHNFIEEQLKKIEENSNVIDEIDSLIGGYSR